MGQLSTTTQALGKLLQFRLPLLIYNVRRLGEFCAVKQNKVNYGLMFLRLGYAPPSFAWSVFKRLSSELSSTVP